MSIPTFELERFFARYEFNIEHLFCCSDCETFTLEELLDMEEGAREEFLRLQLGYTESNGNPELRREIARLYHNIDPDQILVFTGAQEAIFAFMNSFLEQGDHIVV